MLTSFIVDLKLREDGAIKILEFCASGQSGFEGYTEVTPHPQFGFFGLDMMRGHIEPFMREQFGIPLRDEREKQWLCHADTTCPEHFDPEDFKTYSFIHYPDHEITNHNRREQAEYPHIAMVDVHGGLAAHYKNKAILAANLEKVLGDAAPSQGVFLAKYSPQLAADIRKKVGEADDYVIKPVNAARGAGVVIVKDEQLDETLQQLLSRSLSEDDDGRKTYWKNYVAPVFVVQKRERSKLIEKDGKHYDGTMRVVMTAWQEDGETKLKIHDAYWKLPKVAVGESGQDAISYSTPVSTSAYFETSSRELGHAAAVSQQDKDQVFGQLEKVIPAVVTKMAAKDYEPLMENLLLSRDPVKAACGVMMATDSTLVNYMDEENHIQPLPKRVTNRISEIVKHEPDGAVANYLRRLQAMRKEYPAYFCTDGLEKVLDTLPPIPQESEAGEVRKSNRPR